MATSPVSAPSSPPTSPGITNAPLKKSPGIAIYKEFSDELAPHRTATHLHEQIFYSTVQTYEATGKGIIDITELKDELTTKSAELVRTERQLAAKEQARLDAEQKAKNKDIELKNEQARTERRVADAKAEALQELDTKVAAEVAAEVAAATATFEKDKQELTIQLQENEKTKTAEIQAAKLDAERPLRRQLAELRAETTKSPTIVTSDGEYTEKAIAETLNEGGDGKDKWLHVGRDRKHTGDVVENQRKIIIDTKDSSRKDWKQAITNLHDCMKKKGYPTGVLITRGTIKHNSATCENWRKIDYGGGEIIHLFANVTTKACVRRVWEILEASKSDNSDDEGQPSLAQHLQIQTTKCEAAAEGALVTAHSAMCSARYCVQLYSETHTMNARMERVVQTPICSVIKHKMKNIACEAGRIQALYDSMLKSKTTRAEAPHAEQPPAKRTKLGPFGQMLMAAAAVSGG